eukprot:2887636-Amphidinium_carterae.1
MSKARCTSVVEHLSLYGVGSRHKGRIVCLPSGHDWHITLAELSTFYKCGSFQSNPPSVHRGIRRATSGHPSFAARCYICVEPTEDNGVSWLLTGHSLLVSVACS